MIEIKIRKFAQDEPWIENLEKYLPKNGFGALKYILETTLASPIAPSVSLYFYDVDNIINVLIDPGLITFKYELIIIENNIRLFGGFIDPKSVNRNIKEKIISFTILSYRYILKFKNGEEIYDRYYDDSQNNQTKVWYNFKSVNSLVNKIYDKLNANNPSIVTNKFIDHYHLLNSSGEKFLSFRNKDEIFNMPESTKIYAVLNDPNDKNQFAIFVNGGYYKGNFDIGFRFIVDSWFRGGDSVEPASWINQGLDTVVKVHANTRKFRMEGPYGDALIYWDTANVAYPLDRKLGIGLKWIQYGSGYAREIVAASNLYSGGSWGAWNHDIVHGYQQSDGPMLIPYNATHFDVRDNKWYSIYRTLSGKVHLLRFLNSEPPFNFATHRYDSIDGLFTLIDPQWNWYRIHNAKLVIHGNTSYLYMLRWDTQELIICHLRSGTFTLYNLRSILGDNIYWNLESLTYNSSLNEYFSWVLEADNSLVMYKGLPYRSDFERISSIYKLNFGSTKGDDSNNWNPVEINFQGQVTDTDEPNDANWLEHTGNPCAFFSIAGGNKPWNTWEGWSRMYHTISMANIPNGDLMSSIFFNQFGNHCQFVTHSPAGDIIIADGNFTDKTYSDIIKDLALNSRSVEYIDKNQKMFFFDRKRAIPKIYKLRTAANSIVCNVAYITHADKLDLDPGMNSYTIECLCSSNPSAVDSVLIHDGYSGSDDRWMIFTDNSGIIKAMLSDGIVTINLNSQEDLWLELGMYYIVLEIDRELNLAKLYVNGILKDSQDITALGAINSPLDLCIGRYKYDGNIEKPWNGYVREIRITRQALRQDTITAQNLEFNGWETLEHTVGHWNFNEQNTRDLSKKKNFLTIRQHGTGSLRLYYEDELLKLQDVTTYLSTEVIYTVWENYFDGIKVNYADGEIEIGQTDPGKTVFNISVNYIYVESQARIIAESYYNFFNTRRNKLECEFFNFYPVLYKHYIVNNKTCVCIEAIYYRDSDRSIASFVEVT